MRQISEQFMGFYRLFAALFLILATWGTPAQAAAGAGSLSQEQETAGHAGDEKKGFDAAATIFGHISDAHDWHFLDFNGHPVSLPLPVIIWHPEKGLSVFASSRFDHGHSSYLGYSLERTQMKEKIVSADQAEIVDLSITKNVMSMLISVALMLWLMLSAAKVYKRKGSKEAPSGMQGFLEPIIIFIRDEVAKPSLGRHYLRFTPLLLTIFFFIWINNLLGLIPGAANFTGNLAVTSCLALITFIVMIANGNRHFWGHLFNPPGVPLGIKFILVPIEIISLFIKPIALMIRLFANIMAGHIIILSVVSMIFIFGSLNVIAGWGFAPISLAFTIFMFFLELLVGAIQAFIFANLTAVFIGQSVEESHDHAPGADHGPVAEPVLAK